MPQEGQQLGQVRGGQNESHRRLAPWGSVGERGEVKLGRRGQIMGRSDYEQSFEALLRNLLFPLHAQAVNTGKFIGCGVSPALL